MIGDHALALTCGEASGSSAAQASLLARTACLMTASQIASASAMSFFCRWTEGFTSAGVINRTV